MAGGSPTRRVRLDEFLLLLPPLLVTVFLMAAFPPSLSAQAGGSSDWTAPRWVGDVAFVSTNALLGGLTAGVMRRLDGGEFRDGFASGALGGATTYAGRRVAVARFDGAGLLGRQVSGVGASMVRNAGEGDGILDKIVFPLGPVRLHVDRTREFRVQPRVSLHDLAWTVGFALRSGTEFDASASLSAGAPVFRSPLRRFRGPDGEGTDGVAVAGVIGLSDVPEERLRTVFPHERVHVLQNDFAFLVWSDPAESRLLSRHRWGEALYRWVDVGVTFPALRGGLYRAFDVEHGDQWAEIEAKFLDRGTR